MSKRCNTAGALMFLFACAWAANADPVYVQTNLVSDVPGMAPLTDPNLVNPWGVSFSATSPFWVSNAGSNTTTLYNNMNQLQLTVGVAGGPTGQVNIPATLPATDFPVNNATGTPTRASFVFDTLGTAPAGGQILGWVGGLTAATPQVSTPGAAYTGLAFGTVGTTPYVYAANFAQNSIDVYDSTWKAATLTGKFTDPNLPAGYVPYNIQNINGNLYVLYAEAGAGPMSPGRGAGLGIVDVYSTDGVLMNRLISPGSALNAPWGIVMAPAGFGAYANDLLVGNFGNGEINVFSPTGTFIATLDGPNGSPIIDNNLWALAVRTGGGFDTNGVYFTAGINGQRDGLFGVIDPAPEPGTFTMLALVSGMSGMAVLIRRRKLS